jgi:hypothetical protein
MQAQLQEGTDLLGIPLPSDEPFFVFMIIVHIALSLVAVISGIVAMFKEKNALGHATFGRIYYWSICLAFATVIILSIVRWPHNIHLLSIGIATITLVLIGRNLAKTKKKNWARLHTISMGGSYILLLTGFYVDNGKNLPFWSQFPQWFFWVFPSLVGIPIILRVLRKHPLTQMRSEI